MFVDLNDTLREMCIQIRSRNASTYRCRIEGRGYTTHIASIPSVKDTICAVLNKSRSNNVWVATNSRSQGLDVHKVVQRQAIERGQLELANGVLLLTDKDGDGLSRAERDEILSERRLDKHILKQIYVLSPDGKAELVPNKQKAEFDVRAFIYTPAITHGFSEQMHERQFTHVFGIFNSASGACARDASQQMYRLRGAKTCFVGISNAGKELDDEDVQDRAAILLAPANSTGDFKELPISLQRADASTL
jgi:hypothetical protein